MGPRDRLSLRRLSLLVRRLSGVDDEETVGLVGKLDETNCVLSWSYVRSDVHMSKTRDLKVQQVSY